MTAWPILPANNVPLYSLINAIPYAERHIVIDRGNKGRPSLVASVNPDRRCREFNKAGQPVKQILEEGG
jgi:hypothetical protein